MFDKYTITQGVDHSDAIRASGSDRKRAIESLHRPLNRIADKLSEKSSRPRKEWFSRFCPHIGKNCIVDECSAWFIDKTCQRIEIYPKGFWKDPKYHNTYCNFGEIEDIESYDVYFFNGKNRVLVKNPVFCPFGCDVDYVIKGQSLFLVEKEQVFRDRQLGYCGYMGRYL